MAARLKLHTWVPMLCWSNVQGRCRAPCQLRKAQLWAVHSGCKSLNTPVVAVQALPHIAQPVMQP
jgi:hypothetical protein